MGLLSSKNVKFTSSGKSIAALMGLGSIIEIWERAQNLRGKDEVHRSKSELNKNLSHHSKEMLKTAIDLYNNDRNNKNAQLDVIGKSNF